MTLPHCPETTPIPFVESQGHAPACVPATGRPAGPGAGVGRWRPRGPRERPQAALRPGDVFLHCADHAHGARFLHQERRLHGLRLQQVLGCVIFGCEGTGFGALHDEGTGFGVSVWETGFGVSSCCAWGATPALSATAAWTMVFIEHVLGLLCGGARAWGLVRLHDGHRVWCVRMTGTGFGASA